ncbi:hypothetical protein EUGRSUZ_F00546 [Eucalyptus grandis]|uniref:Uncharacterized protein n=2 Tax=Eucalyptus grandis TaxID=71139 RepID=A0ACC3KBG9_EUCGR|nr:hypothetical protein EUGRSUZ_F00546 [Eucalyptus grandis]
MEIECAGSSVRKKPRILVERWLKETERARNKFQIIGQAHTETLPPKEQVETLTREVEELIGESLPQTLLIEERDAKGVKFWERKLIGEAIHRNIESIWDRLIENHVCKLGIYGMGGVGKTTIMMHIHNRLLEDATFDCVIFVTVSKDFSIYKLQSDIGKALKVCITEDEHEKKRAVMLSEHLERKKNCVLILDDMWENLDLEEVGIPIRADGFKIVITTRSFDVCRRMQCQEKIKIQPLSQKEAESLFLEDLGPEVPLNMEIETIMKSIVEECAGLPMGVITVARTMRGVTDVFDWRDSLVKLKESSMGQPDMEKKVLMNLKFSYDRLGNPNVQRCFLSCALYPEDELISEFKLVEFFIDQGLIGELNTRKEQYDRGLTILNQLVNACLLEDHGLAFVFENNGHHMKMHDLIRDMALHVMNTTSIVKAGNQLRNIPSEEYWMNSLEKVSLMKNCFKEFPLNMSPNCPKLSTLLLNGCLLRNLAIPNSFFKNLLGLKVLNLSENHMTELPNSISDLVNLRALLLRECSKLCCIPYLGKLTSLRKLDAKKCFRLEVLEGLEKLVNLRYLDLTEMRIERLSKGTLDHLLNLQWFKVGAINKEDITKLGALETFSCYLKNVDDFNKCVRAIEQSNNPRHYCLHAYEKSFSKNKRFFAEKMVGIIAAVTSPPPHLLPFFPCLEKILIKGCHKMKRVVESEWMPHFPALRRIEVSVCEKMEEIIGGPPQYLPVEEISLESLDVNCCDNMRKLFPHEWLLHLRNLQRISVTHCKGMVEMISGARQGQEGSTMTPVNNTPSSFQPLISLPKLEYLLLYNLPQLKSICKVPISCDSMEDLRVCECPELKGIPLQLRLCEIEELPYIWVEDEETWKTLMWDHPNAQAILQPYLQKGKDFNHPHFVGMQYTPNAIG